MGQLKATGELSDESRLLVAENEEEGNEACEQSTGNQNVQLLFLSTSIDKTQANRTTRHT